MFSPNFHLVEEATCFPCVVPWYPTWNEIHSHLPLQQGSRFYIALELTCCLFDAYCHEKRIVLIYQLVFISILCIHFRNESISIENTTSSLLCCRQLSKRCISKLSVAVYYKQNRSTSRPLKRSYGCLRQLLFIISGTFEINPEPTRLKYACGQCNHAVKNPENSNCMWFM